jgi:hypothetical protein
MVTVVGGLGPVRLDAHQGRGILTEAEFQAKKTDLLRVRLGPGDDISTN